MNSSYLLGLLAFPLIWPWIAKRIWHQTINWIEMGVHIAIPVILISIVVVVGRYGQTSDTEIWNGQITSKQRDHGYWEESYDCMCVTMSCGDDCSYEVCQTCYRDHYTVDWYLKSTLGKFRLQYKDWESKRVYNEPDPTNYTRAYVGEPCSREMSYTNYIQAVPESIFNYAKGNTVETFADLIPEYPTVYGKYHINRVLTPGITMPYRDRVNLRLGEALRTIGAKKQANIILIVVNTPDQTYRHAIEEAWLGGKKNDIIVMIGAPDFPNIAWVDTITLGANAGNSLMAVTMRDEIMKLKSFENGIRVADTITDTITKLFDRKAMDDFKYLEDEIKPPLWVIITALILGIGGSLGLTFLFHREDFFENRYRRYR